MNRFILLLILALCLSCEAQKHILVIVLDEQSKTPLDSVFVQVRAGKNGDYNKNYAAGYTDSTGRFETYMMIGCSGGCYDIYIDYSKKAYRKKTDFNVTEGEIFLTKE